MTAVDDLSELVERAAAAERTALAAKWKDRAEVEGHVRRMRRTADDLAAAMVRDTDPDRVSPRWAGLRGAYLAAGSEPDGAPPPSPEAAAQAERDAVAAVALARLSLVDAGVAVLQARLARIDAGEEEQATGGGHTPAYGRNPVSRHGPALAHGVSGEIRYVLARKPRSTIKSLAVSLALGLLYLGFLRLYEWDTKERLLPYLGLWVISVVMGGAVCINAMSFDSLRVRAALESGERLWQILVVKNAALFCIVAPFGFLLSALLAWRAGDFAALLRACVLVSCFILLWLGVGNILSVGLPIRDEPILQRRRSGSLRQFLIAFAVSFVAGYAVNGALIWRVYAARALTERLGSAWIPGLLILLSCVVTWVLLTVFAIALAQQPRVRRALQREIADYTTQAAEEKREREPDGRVSH